MRRPITPLVFAICSVVFGACSSGGSTVPNSGALAPASATPTASRSTASPSPGPSASSSPTANPTPTSSTHPSPSGAPSGAASSTPSPTPSPSPTPTPSPIPFNDFTTYGYDNARDEFNPNSTTITPTSLATLHLAWQSALGGNGDYNTQGEPVLATEIAGHAGVLFLGGGTGNTYAYDALTGTELWQTFLGSESYTCENGYIFYFGVGGSAAYDPASKSIYIVGNKNASSNATATNSLFQLDGATGNMLGNVNFAPNPVGANELDFSHTSVALANGYAYVGTGATCDINSWRGRVAAIAVPALTLANTFFTTWGGPAQPWGGGGVWGWGGVAVDGSGNVVAGTGNASDAVTGHGPISAPFTAAPEEFSAWAETVTSLSPGLAGIVGSNHPIPTSVYAGNSVDLDIASTPVIFTPGGTGCDPEAAVQSKSGTLFLYDETQISAGPISQYQLSPSTFMDEFLGSPAYSPVTGLLYVATPSSSNSLFPPGMIAISPGCGNSSVAWNSSFGPDTGTSGLPRSAVSVSAGGVVFVATTCSTGSTGNCASSSSSRTPSARVDATTMRRQICCSPPSSAGGAVWAVDASTGIVLNGGSPLVYTSGAIRAPVMLDGSWLYVLDTSGNLYGLTIDSRYAAVDLKHRAVSPRVMRHWEPLPVAHHR